MDKILKLLDKTFESNLKECESTLSKDDLVNDEWYCKLKSVFQENFEYYVQKLKDSNCYNAKNWKKNAKHIYYNYLYDENTEYNQIFDFISNIGKKHHDFLFIENLNIRRLPTNIETLAPFLTSLKIDDCEVKVLNHELFKLTNLRDLQISKCPIYVIPPKISKLKNLERLCLTRLRISELPDLSDLQNLKILDVSFNFLSTMPNLPVESLEVLYCDTNATLVINQSSIQQCINLKKLDCSGTSSFQLDFANHPSLIYLNISMQFRQDQVFQLLNITCTKLRFLNISNSTIILKEFLQLLELSPFLNVIQCNNTITSDGKPFMETLIYKFGKNLRNWGYSAKPCFIERQNNRASKKKIDWETCSF